MNSSKLKPLLLRNLRKLFEIDPSPNAWGKVDSLASNTHGATRDQVVRMIEHLSHEGLVKLAELSTGKHISVTEKGIEWLEKHDGLQEKRSIKTWLLKPLTVAVITALFTVPITVYITESISKAACQE